MAFKGTGEVKRQEFLLFANVSKTETPEWEVIGKDLESLTVDLNNTVESKQNILGESSTTITRGTKSSSVSPYKVRKESKLGEIVYKMARDGAELSECELEFLQVFVFDEVSSGAYYASKQKCAIDVKSYGGDTKGLDIPFDIHFTGSKTEGTFDPGTKKFTAAPGI